MRSTSTVLMFMLYLSKQVIRNCRYLPPNTRRALTVNRLIYSDECRLGVDPTKSMKYIIMEPKNYLIKHLFLTLREVFCPVYFQYKN